MQTTKDILQKQLLCKFHTLCAKAGLESYEKREMMSSYNVESSTELSVNELIELCAKLEETLNPKIPEMDVWRKRLMASIGGWLRAMNFDENAQKIKSIACRAAKKERFNNIPLEQLRSLYYAFKKKKDDLEMVDVMTVDELDILKLLN